MPATFEEPETLRPVLTRSPAGGALDQFQPVLDLVELPQQPCRVLGKRQGDLVLYLVGAHRLSHGGLVRVYD